MADFVFNIGKGAFAEKVRDDATKVGVLLLKATEGDAGLKDRVTVAAILGAAGNTEADFTNYARKTPITAVLNVDQGNDRVDISIPDQTWAAAGNNASAAGSGAGNNVLAKLIIFYDEGGTDATRIPMLGQDFVASTDGNALQTQFNAAGIYRAS